MVPIFFLQCLQEQGIKSKGVERKPAIANYGRGMRFNTVIDDALAYLDSSNDTFDGVYCSHFVEHLPFQMVETLLGSIASILRPGGVATLAFPDPESIRSQLLGFWRDPEHVRFYHPELITSVAFTFGLDLEWSSHHAQPHRIASFTDDPDPVPQPIELSSMHIPAKPDTLVGKWRY